MNLSAWRPLKDAPKVWGVIVVRGLGMDRVAMYREGDGEDVKRWRVFNEPEISPLIEPLWEYAPVADTYELDRAVQILVVQAFTMLFAGMQNLVIARENPCRSRPFAEQYVGYCIRQAAPIMHVAFGGRIPDEVPR